MHHTSQVNPAVYTSYKMHKFLILLLAVRLTATDKIGRAYLPPPGAKLSGGNPEELQVPLEYPKETLQTTTEQQTELSNRLPTPGNYENLIIGTNLPIGILTNHKKDAENTSNEYALENFTNTSPILVPSNKDTPTTYSTDENYGTTTLGSNQGFFPSFLNAPLQTSLTTTDEPKLQETTTITGNIPSTLILPVIEKKYQNPSSIIYESPIPSGLNSNQSNIESNFYQNQRPDNPEFNIPKGIQPKLDLNQFPKHQDASYAHNFFISATSRPEYIIPDLKIDTYTKVDKSTNFRGTSVTRNNPQVFDNIVLPSDQSGLKIYGQKKNNESYRALDKDSHNTPKQIPVLVTSSAGFSNQESPTYLTSSMQAIIKKNMDSRKIISNRPERLQAIADRSSVILNYKNVINPMEFAYSFDSSNGIHADENGTTANGVQVQGSYTYTGDDGKVYRVIYTADKNGFQPRGDHLPTPPPLPQFIQRLIEDTARDKENGNSDDGSYDDAKYGYKKYQGAMDHYSPEIQGISLEGIKHIGSKRKMYSHRRLTIADKPSNIYEDNTKNQYNGGNPEPDLYNNQLSRHPLDMLPENDNSTIKFDTNRQKGMMKNKFPVSKAYTKDENQLLNKFKVSIIDGIQNNQTMQPEYKLRKYNKYLNEKSKIEMNIPRDENKQFSYNIYSAPIEKLNDDQTNIDMVNSEVYGALDTDYFSMYKDPNSGYRYEKPEIKFSYEFKKDPMKGEKQNNTYPKNIFSDYSSYKEATTQPDNKEYLKNTNDFGNESTNQNVHENNGITRIPVFIKTTKTSITQRPQITDTPYQQYTQHGRNFIQEEALTSGQYIDNSNFENMNGSGYFLVPSTTPMTLQSATDYIETEPSTSAIYPTTVRPRTDYFDETKAIEYPVDAIKPNTIPPRYEISQGFENSSANVVVDGFGRPITTSQTYREFTGYVYGPGYSNTFEIDDIVPNLPSKNINQDDSDVSEIHSVVDMSNSPYDVINNILNQEEGLKEKRILDGPAFDDLSTIEFVENHSTTEKIIGEDFNGPKQRQSYDPETGYRYK